MKLRDKPMDAKMATPSMAFLDVEAASTQPLEGHAMLEQA
jgi:hypothetical protein